MRDGVAPPQSPAIELGADPAAPDPIVRDARGNAKGGIRLPEVEAPTATIDGGANTMAHGSGRRRGAATSVSCSAARSCSTPPRVKSLYPTHDAFVKQFDAAVDALIKNGYWLSVEGAAAKKAAQESSIGR